MNHLVDILDQKGRDVLRIDAGASVLDAVRQMVDHNVGSLLVEDEGKISAIVTERDYLRYVALDGPPDHEIAVREIASAPLIVADPEMTVDECMALMTERRIRHLPVSAGDEIVGMISIGDVVKYQLERHQSEVKYLNEYITAR